MIKGIFLVLTINGTFMGAVPWTSTHRSCHEEAARRTMLGFGATQKQRPTFTCEPGLVPTPRRQRSLSAHS